MSGPTLPPANPVDAPTPLSCAQHAAELLTLAATVSDADSAESLRETAAGWRELGKTLCQFPPMRPPAEPPEESRFR